MSRPPSYCSSGKNPNYTTSHWCVTSSQLPPHPPPYSAVKPIHSHNPAYPYYVQGTVMIPVPLGTNAPPATLSPPQSTYVTNYIYNGETSSGPPVGTQVQIVESSSKFDWIPTTTATATNLTGKAVLGGDEALSSRPVWVIRSWHCGDLIPGKLSLRINKASVPYGGKEITVQNFEVLCARPENLRWVEASEGNVPPGAIVGGHTANGETLYVGRVRHRSLYTKAINVPGKVHPSHHCCYIGVEGKEVSKTTYEVLTRI